MQLSREILRYQRSYKSSDSLSTSSSVNVPYVKKSCNIYRIPLLGLDVKTLREHRGNLYIWWFPPEFCQSNYGEYRESGLHSCTLISLLLADKVSKQPHNFLHNSNRLPLRAVELFSTAINEGNKVYKRCFTNCPKRHTKNINIPDAISSLRKQSHKQFRLQEWFFTHSQANPKQSHYRKSIAQRLAYILHVGLDSYFKYRQGLGRKAPATSHNSRFLFAALISNSRTMSFVFDLFGGMVAVFDSHQHGRKAGAVIAICGFCDIIDLMKWLIDMQIGFYSRRPTIFEISFLTPMGENPPVPKNAIKSLN